MTTSMSPTDGSASSSNVSVDKSMTRDVSAGPQSATLHSVTAPVDTRVTLITVPNGSVRWAHVRSGAPNHDATPRSVCPEGCWAGRTSDGSDTTTPPVVVVVVAGAAVVGGADDEVVACRAAAAVVDVVGGAAVLDVVVGRTVDVGRAAAGAVVDEVGADSTATAASTPARPAGTCGVPG